MVFRKCVCAIIRKEHVARVGSERDCDSITFTGTIRDNWRQTWGTTSIKIHSNSLVPGLLAPVKVPC